jgi:DNA-binding transcriptional ArsR family regulator
MSADTHKCTFGVDSSYVELAAEIFGLLSDPTRIRIILALRAGELPVNRLAEVVGKSPAAVSQHLAKLRMSRVVGARRDGNSMLYSLTGDHARRLVAEAVFQAEHAIGDQPLHHRVCMAESALDCKWAGPELAAAS